MGNQNRWTGMVMGVFMGVLFSAVVVLAGGLEPSVGPTEGASQMYTLEEIYNRINNGVAATKKTEITEPNSGPTAGTMHTLDDIYALVGLRAPVPQTGQTTCYNLGSVIPCAGTGQDGDLKKGVAWPNPRFTDNNNGTVTDNLTGLIWLKDANCGGSKNWTDALSAANTLASGNCSLSDSSTAGQWRLPNINELLSLIDRAFYNPALSNTAGTEQWTEGAPFTGVQSNYYASSTTAANSTDGVWFVFLGDGFVSVGNKTSSMYYVWPVRGGQ